MRRIRCALGIRVLASLVLMVLAVAPGAARAGQADTDSETSAIYASPRYGYTLRYEPDDWSIAFEDDNPTDRFDRVFFSNGPSLVSLTGHPDYAADELAECVIDFELGVGGAALVSAVVPLDERGAAGDDGDRVWATFVYTPDQEGPSDEPVAAYVECRWLGDGLTLVVRHDAALDIYDDEIRERNDLLAGFAPSERDPGGRNATEVDAADPRDETARAGPTEVYESPLYGFTVSYDSVAWRIVAEDGSPDDPYDRVDFSNGPSLIVVWGDPDYDEDEMAACVEDYVALAGGDADLSSIEPIDASGASGETDGRAWATIIYVWEFREGAEAEFVQYYECIWLGDGVTAVILHEVSDTSYDKEIPLRESFVAGIAPADGGSGNSSQAISLTTGSSLGETLAARGEHVVGRGPGRSLRTCCGEDLI